MPCEPLDALKNLTKEVPRQVAFGKLPGEVPGMPDEASARPEQPLLEAREGPGLDGDGQCKPAEQIAEAKSHTFRASFGVAIGARFGRSL